MTIAAVQAGRIYEFGLSDRLRAARESAGFDMRSFETLTGISKGSIYNYEAGKTRPRRPQILAWAMATGFDAYWLETGNAPAESQGDFAQRARRDSNPQPSDP
ncbi:MAG: helix-turn-helix domain-containing protein [Propionibacteriaceae bacterium]|nr:helix-turn-helix domain-containing protein [Propionibacteriaceae bacterium]